MSFFVLEAMEKRRKNWEPIPVGMVCVWSLEWNGPRPEPVFVNLAESDSLESIPGLLKCLQIRAQNLSFGYGYKYVLWKAFTLEV